MTTFDDRDKAFENKFAHDEELKFKIHARAVKLLGVWAAGLLNKNTQETEAYAVAAIEADLKSPGTQDVEKQILYDFSKAGVAVTAKEIERKLEDLLAEARRQVMHGE